MTQSRVHSSPVSSLIDSVPSDSPRLPPPLRFRVPPDAVVGSNSISDDVAVSLEELLAGRGRRAAGIGLL